MPALVTTYSCIALCISAMNMTRANAKMGNQGMMSDITDSGCTFRLYFFYVFDIQVLCLYCGVSMLNTCHPTAVNNQQLPGHLSCTSRQINFILTHLSAFVLHSVILLSYLLSPLSSVLLPSTILVSKLRLEPCMYNGF